MLGFLITLHENGSVSRDQWDEWHAGLGTSDAADEPWYSLVKQHLQPEDVDDRRVLEIGCGRGSFARWLANSSSVPREIVAVDYSAQAIEIARRSATAATARIVWRTGDIQRIDEPPGSFDTVVSCETIEHVPDPARAVRELARVLRPGGRLFLTTPNYMGPMGLYRGYLRLMGRHFTEVGQPINRFTAVPRTWAWLRRAGLRVCRFDARGHYAMWPGRPPWPVPALDRPWLRWFALHSLFVASHPHPSGTAHR